MRKCSWILIIAVSLCLSGVLAKDLIKLPAASYKGDLSLEEAIFQRKSTRAYREEPITLKELSQLLWSCAGASVDGLTGPTRVYPSAGGIYPIEIYVAVSKVKNLAPGVYSYQWQDHTLIPLKEGNFNKELSAACLNQPWVNTAAVNFIFLADKSKVGSRYGKRGQDLFLALDVGTSCENLHLQAESLGLGTIMIGAFQNERVKKILDLTRHDVFCIMPVGRK